MFRHLTIEDIPEMLELQTVVLASLKNNQLFKPDDADFFKEQFSNGGTGLGFFEKGSLIAYGVLTKPTYDNGELAVSVGVSKFELHLTMYMDSIVVHPQHWGRNLQMRLLFLLEGIARIQGCWYLCSTVAPNNTWGFKNLMHCGYEIKDTGIRDGVLKHLMYKYI